MSQIYSKLKGFHLISSLKLCLYGADCNRKNLRQEMTDIPNEDSKQSFMTSVSQSKCWEKMRQKQQEIMDGHICWDLAVNSS